MFTFSKYLRKLASVLKLIAEKLEKTHKSGFNRELNRWYKDDGDKTHRLNYDLNENSIVIDLGGYEGQWTSDIYSKYKCSVLVFEPYIPFAENIEKRFAKNLDIKVYRFGLGARTESIGFSVMDNSSSIFKKGSLNETIELVCAFDFLNSNNIRSVDLIKINIEGAEYELLESLIDFGIITKFKNIQVQFHDNIIENALERMRSIQKKLTQTHRLTYNYHFVWENWSLIE